MIIIAPLSTGQNLTLAVWSSIQNADKLFLQTTGHPFAKPIVDSGKAFSSMDDLYESAVDFDALNREIARRLVQAEDCVYAVTGNIEASQLPVIRSAAMERGIQVRLLPGVPLWRDAFPEEPWGISFPANAAPERISPDAPAYVEELDGRLAAGEIKLQLMEYWPDEWPVKLAVLDGDGEYTAVHITLSQLDRQPDAYYQASTVLCVPAAGFDDLHRYGYAELMQVMKRLRAPGGCPWDREQTHASLKLSVLEECYELMDAIDKQDDDAMTEELGDVLLQVVFHAVIAQEQGRFSDRDVTSAIVSKLVYRHPHIFGSVKADTSEEVLLNWDKLKKKEKRQQTQADVLNSVPKSFPALIRSRKVQKRAGDVGFDWTDAKDAFYKIAEETEELREAMEGNVNVEEELGDLLFAVVNVARLLKLEPEFALAASTEKFIRRFAEMERLILEKGLVLEKMQLNEMDIYWDLAKKTLNLGDSEK